MDQDLFKLSDFIGPALPEKNSCDSLYYKIRKSDNDSEQYIRFIRTNVLELDKKKSAGIYF